MAKSPITEVTSEEVFNRKRSDSLFIFGSGYSINDLTAAEIEIFSQHDTLSFNWFIYQDFIRIDYHLIRELASNDRDSSIWKQEFAHYSGLLKKSPFYQNTLFVIQVSMSAVRLLANHCLPEEAACLFYYKCPVGTKYPNTDFKSGFGGLVHGPSTLFDCMNFAYLFGWKKIILVGVDLYDRRHFWLKADETDPRDVIRNKNYWDEHNTTREAIIWAKRWRKYFQREGIQLSVYNPKSLLAKVVPIFRR